MPDRILDPMDRISEVLFGLIMALTFTCTLGVAAAEVRTMLIGALGCNLAWGIIDGGVHSPRPCVRVIALIPNSGQWEEDCQILACPALVQRVPNEPRNGISSLTGLCRPARRAHPPFGAARARSALAADYASPCARQLPTTSRISCSFLIL